MPSDENFHFANTFESKKRVFFVVADVVVVVVAVVARNKTK